jgi:UDP-N-acetyl-D-mannosaminuronic acid dehydrogenase
VAHCPERVLPGRILAELVANDRVVGGVDRASGEAARALYVSFVEGEIVVTDAVTAEMAKLMENTFRDVNIALANEFALIAETVGVNVWEAIAIANRHPRVNILRPGPGVGGHCIAVDPWFLVESAPADAHVIRNARERNDDMPARVFTTVERLLDDVRDPAIAILGLTYKADVDDVRESPAVKVVELLVRAGYDVRLHDPFVERVHELDLPVLRLGEAISGADCLVLLTDHQTFVRLDPLEIADVVRNRRILDTRGSLSTAAWSEAGFAVTVLGDGRARRSAVPV